MKWTLPHIVLDFELIAMTISFIVSIRLINNSRIPKYMKGFYWYSFIAFFVLMPDFVCFYFFQQFSSITVSINYLSLIFHYIFLSQFIIRVTPSKKYTTLIFYFFLVLLIIFLAVDGITGTNTSSFAIANLGLTCFSIIYYFQLFRNIPIIDLKKEASFWIITGIFFCMTVHIPAFGMINYLAGKISGPQISLLASITTFSYGVMHVFFIKGYLCSTRLKKS